MKRSLAFVDQRRNAILRILQQYGSAKVSDLAERLSVSPLTIRRDLDYLQEQHIVERSYGTATLLDPLSNAFSSSEIQCKNAIARAAARLVRDQETILINTSSTALLILEYVSARNITIVTNNANILNLDTNPAHNIILSGGELRVPKNAMVGEFAIQNIRKVKANRAFIGCSGIDPDDGISTAVMQEGPINQLMMEQAEEVNVLADHSKIGVSSNFTYSDLQRVSRLITDQNVNKSVLRRFRQMSIDVIAVESTPIGQMRRTTDEHGLPPSRRREDPRYRDASEL